MPRIYSLSKEHKSTIFHWIRWGKQISANTTNYGVEILWQILTINKRNGVKNLTDLLSGYFWMKYFYKVTRVQKGLQPLSGPSKIPSGAWRYDEAPCQDGQWGCGGQIYWGFTSFSLLAWSHQPLLAAASSICIACFDCRHWPFEWQHRTVGRVITDILWGTGANY